MDHNIITLIMIDLNVGWNIAVYKLLVLLRTLQVAICTLPFPRSIVFLNMYRCNCRLVRFSSNKVLWSRDQHHKAIFTISLIISLCIGFFHGNMLHLPDHHSCYSRATQVLYFFQCAFHAKKRLIDHGCVDSFCPRDCKASGRKLIVVNFVVVNRFSKLS